MRMILAGCFSIIFYFCLPLVSTAQTLYQTGTMVALMNGIYFGTDTISTLVQQGNLGLGTVDKVAGEMVIIDGQAYVTVDNQGNTRKLAWNEKTPFAVVMRFEPDDSNKLELTNIDSINALESSLDHYIEDKLGGENLFYVIKIDGTFSRIVVRSMTPPKDPVQPLPEVVASHEMINDYEDIEGTLVIVKLPEYVSPLSVPGYHSHFISKDRKKSGHLYDVSFIHPLNVHIVQSHEFNLALPTNQQFLDADLKSVLDEDIIELETR